MFVNNIIGKLRYLSQREKLLLSLVIVIFTPLLILRFVFMPLQSYQDESQANISRLERKVESMSLLGQELQYYSRSTGKSAPPLNKRIDGILRQTKLLAKSKSSVVDQASVDQKLNLTLNEINLTELSTLLYTIEHSRPVILINTMDLAPSYQNIRLFRVSLALSSK